MGPEKKQAGKFPKQHQEKQPGERSEMEPKPQTEKPGYRPSGKLEGKIAMITGGDSGIGRAVAILFAKEGADLSIVYLNEDRDGRETKDRIRELGRQCLLISGDVGNAGFCRQAVDQTLERFGRLDVLINNAGEQHICDGLLEKTGPASASAESARTEISTLNHR